MVLWKGRSQWKTKVSRSKCSKQEMQWLSISWNHGKKSKRRQPRELKHKIKEANEHKLECKPEHKANNRDQDKTSDTFYHFNFKTYIFPDQHFSHRQECDGGIKLIWDASTCQFTVTRMCLLQAIKIVPAVLLRQLGLPLRGVWALTSSELPWAVPDGPTWFTTPSATPHDRHFIDIKADGEETRHSSYNTNRVWVSLT